MLILAGLSVVACVIGWEIGTLREKLNMLLNYLGCMDWGGKTRMNVGFYSWLNAYLRHLLSAAPSCWPDAAKAPIGKRGMKYGSAKKSSQLETMALAGILAPGYDALKARDRRFLRIVDEYEAGMISTPELYAQLSQFVKRGVWNRIKFYRLKKQLEQKVVKLNKKTLKKRVTTW